MGVYYFVMTSGHPAIICHTRTMTTYDEVFEHLGDAHPSECFWLVPGTVSEED